MHSATIMNDLPTPMWIALILLGFVLFWPLGVFALIYFIWSRKMMCCTGPLAGSKRDSVKPWTIPYGAPRTTGNLAFDEYREATLKRLEEERIEFAKFLENLRLAKDKAEFDEFMAMRAAQQTQT